MSVKIRLEIRRWILNNFSDRSARPAVTRVPFARGLREVASGSRKVHLENCPLTLNAIGIARVSRKPRMAEHFATFSGQLNRLGRAGNTVRAALVIINYETWTG